MAASQPTSAQFPVQGSDRAARPMILIGETLLIRDARGATVRYGVYKCSCGKYFCTAVGEVKRGTTKSCGCFKARRLTTHGKHDSAEYRAWCHIRGRCNNPKNRAYPHYGGRGIRVCDRWMESFQNFLSDMGPRPSEKHSIDRIDNDGNYEPGNCRWATCIEQSNNRSDNRVLSIGGKLMTVAQWSREHGAADYSTIVNRLHSGWNDCDAVFSAKRKQKKKSAAVAGGV